MSIKKIEQIKRRKWLSIWDIIVYAVLLAAVVALILGFTLGRDNSALDGFFIAYRGERVFSYDFREGKPRILDSDRVKIEEAEGGFTVHFTADGEGFNDVFVNLSDRTVDVVASNCSSHKDCVYTPKLDSNSSTPIICTPHELSICPLNFHDDGIL